MPFTRNLMVSVAVFVGATSLAHASTPAPKCGDYRWVESGNINTNTQLRTAPCSTQYSQEIRDVAALVDKINYHRDELAQERLNAAKERRCVNYALLDAKYNMPQMIKDAERLSPIRCQVSKRTFVSLLSNVKYRLESGLFIPK